MTVPRPVRYRCELVAQLIPGRLPAQKVRVIELSESGAFIEEAPGHEDLQVGDKARLSINLPGGPPWVGNVRVMRCGTSRVELFDTAVENLTIRVHGFGVHFVSLPDDDLERLRDFLDLLENR